MSSEPQATPPSTTTPSADNTSDATASPLPADEKKLSKNAQKKLAQQQKLAAEKEAKKKDQEEKKKTEQAAKVEKSKSINLVEDEKLPEAHRVEIGQVRQNIGQRVKIFGWAHNIRGQGSNLMFIELRDGTGLPALLQVVFQGNLAKVSDAVTMHREASLCVYGTLTENSKATNSGGIELHADYWKLVGPSDGEIEGRINADSNVEQLADQRHLVLRQLTPLYIMKLRSTVIQCFREHFYAKDFTEVTPPTMVQTQVEGGSTLFKFDFFGEPAYLTQSSQLYLETVVPALGKVFCCMPSFRAEKSRTRRHLAEYTHFEGELAFITYNDLLDLLEDMCVDVADRLVKKAGEMLKIVNPNFVAPKKPFIRMDYSAAVKYCNEHNIYKDEENKIHFEFGDDIPGKNSDTTQFKQRKLDNSTIAFETLNWSIMHYHQCLTRVIIVAIFFCCCRGP
jgi:asparaginyl-tRNA synthetase